MILGPLPDVFAAHVLDKFALAAPGAAKNASVAGAIKARQSDGLAVCAIVTDGDVIAWIVHKTPAAVGPITKKVE